MAEDIRKMESTKGKKSFEVKYEQPHCVVLDSAYCSMGRMIGNNACALAGYRYYDAVTLLELVPECGLTKDDVDIVEQRLRITDLSKEEMLEDERIVKVMEVFEKAIAIALRNGKCLIHDRTVKEAVEALGYSCINVFTTVNDEDYIVERAQTSPLYKNVQDKQDVLRKVAEENRIRRNYHKLQSEMPWGEAQSYDLILNTDVLGRDYCAKILAHVMCAE